LSRLHWRRRGHAPPHPCPADRTARLPPAVAERQRRRRPIHRDRRHLRSSPLSHIDPHHPWHSLHASRAFAVQFFDSRATPPVASLERAHFFRRWTHHRHFRADHELGDARHWRRQSGCRHHVLRFFLPFCPLQSVLAHSPTRNRPAPSVDDSCLLDRPRRRPHPPDRRNLFCHQPPFASDSSRILRARVLDGLHTASHRRRGLDSPYRHSSNSCDFLGAACFGCRWA